MGRIGVYIDGYNLYYGRLRGTPHKWLDLVALFRQLLAIQMPDSTIEFVRYFSAPALARFSTHGTDSTKAQQDYHRALTTLYPGCFSITLGAHTVDRNGSPLPSFVQGLPYDRQQRTLVWKLEEKQTDVNIALAMYRDAAKGRCDHTVVCSNDSDIAPVLKALREDFPHLDLGVVATLHPPVAGVNPSRPVSSSLSSLAHWTRHYLLDAELAAAQLPASIPTRKRPVRKPPHW
jgi:uncharacterized LabA/DUF88 family protein